MYRMRPTDRGSRSFGKPQVTDLPLFHQLGHGAYRLLHRYNRVEAMRIIQVDGVDLQPLQTLVHSLAYPGGRTIHIRARSAAMPGFPIPEPEAELGGDEHL